MDGQAGCDAATGGGGTRPVVKMEMGIGDGGMEELMGGGGGEGG